jgi:hypothetical protein
VSDRILVDTAALRDVAAASTRAARAVDAEEAALHVACRDTASAMGRDDLRRDFPRVWRQSLRMLSNLAGSLDGFGRAISEVADVHDAADGTGVPGRVDPAAGAGR